MAAIDIAGLDPAEVLVALHRAAPVTLHNGYRRLPELTHEEAQGLLEEERTFGYVNGRALFVQFGASAVEVSGYDRHHGDGAAAKVVAGLRGEERAFVEAVSVMAGLK